MELHFQSCGSGPPLIILHGLFGSADNWQSVARRLGEQFEVFSVDQRNHGRSPHSVEMNYPAMAEDLSQFMDARGLASARILGHSMGGKTAMQFALTQSERVAKLVVVDIAPKAYPPLHEAIFKALLSLNLSALQTRGQVDKILAGEIANPALRLFLLKTVGGGPSEGLFWKTNVPGIFWSSEHLRAGLVAASRFDGRALFLRGENSDYILDADIPLIRKFFPKATVRTVPGAGHWVHVDAPAAFLRLLTGFL